MRDIKFRAWIVDHGQTPPKGNMYYGIEDFYSNGKLLSYFEDNQITDEDFLMQYTGLKDKKGVEIYEGDIYTSYGLDGYYVVEFSTGSFIAGPLNETVRVPLGWEGNKRDVHYIETEVEVIGNIHSNPELLK